jgi:hypothetical protein
MGYSVYRESAHKNPPASLSSAKEENPNTRKPAHRNTRTLKKIEIKIEKSQWLKVN